MGIEYPTGHSVDFYGVEVIEYYFKRFLLCFSDYALTVQLLYGLILVCIATMIMLFFLFMFRIWRNNRIERAYKSAHDKLHDGFFTILTSGTKPKVEDIEEACGVPLDEITAYSPDTLSKLISEICMDLSRELGNIPNAEVLCSFTGVKALYERNLATSHDVLPTLQNLANMHIPVSEGLLAIYINHHNDDIRHIARMCHILSSSSDPYRYLVEDLNDVQGLWRFMMLHRLFGWVQDNDQPMPPFLILTEKVENEESVSFLIKEAAYWGSEKEKSMLHTLFLSPNYHYRQAALQAVALLRDHNQEQAAIDSFDQQPEYIRQEVLKAVYAINSGRHTDFFVRAYRNSSLKDTREIALNCLYTYGSDGRRTFELLRNEVLENEGDRVLMDQIDSMSIINQLRMC